MKTPTLYILIYSLLTMSFVWADETQSIQSWKNVLKELNKIQDIATDTTTLQFNQGCAVINEFTNKKGDILSHRFNCLGKKVSVIYQGTFAIVFLEDQQEVKVIDLSVVNEKMNIKNLITHLLIKDGTGIASPLGSAFSPQILTSTPTLVAKKSVFHIFDWFKRHNPTEPVEKFSMNEFSAEFRGADITSGEKFGKLAMVFKNDKIEIAQRHTKDNAIKSIGLSLIPILGGYFSTFYLHAERGEMFHAGKTLKLIDDLVNAHPEELGFLRGHTQEDRDHANLFLADIAQTVGVDPKVFTKNLEKAQDKKIQSKVAESSEFYRDIQETDHDLKKSLQKEEENKKKGFRGKAENFARDFVTNGDSHYTFGDVYEDYIDKYARGPLERINPLFNLLSASNLFRKEAVQAGYLAETYYRQNQEDLYNKSVAMPGDGKEFLPSFATAKESTRNAQAIFAKNLCPSLDDVNKLTDPQQMKLAQIQDHIDGLTTLFSIKQRNFFGTKEEGLGKDYQNAMEALSGKRPNYQKGMDNLAIALRKLEMAAREILSLQRELNGISKTSPTYQAEHLRLLKLMREWGQFNGLVREQMDKIMAQNVNLAKDRKKPIALPADLAYLYSKNPLSQDPSPGGPKESYLELNHWFADSKSTPTQISASLKSGNADFSPPASSPDSSYSTNYKVFEMSTAHSDEMKEKYVSNISVDDFQNFQREANKTYQQTHKSNKLFTIPRK